VRTPSGGPSPHEIIHTSYKEIIMKLKLTAFIFVLTLAVASWAQTATQSTPSVAPQENAAPQAKASCCHKTSDAKEGESCARHKMAGRDEKAKDQTAMSCCAGEKAATCRGGDKAASCCAGKEAKSCMKGDEEKAASCGDCCSGDKDEKGCCASHNEGDKAAMNCCGGNKCGAHSAAHDSIVGN